MTDKELLKQAIIAMGRAYAPYSNYKVGAALLTEEGKVYLGCNIENAAYSPSNCAERTAIFKAVSEGERNFKAIAIVGGKDGKIVGAFPPCGVCRQVMAEFCNSETFHVIVGKGEEEYDNYLLKDLFPAGFNPSYLEK